MEANIWVSALLYKFLKLKGVIIYRIIEHCRRKRKSLDLSRYNPYRRHIFCRDVMPPILSFTAIEDISLARR